ncbi:glutamate receptor 1 [Biomphalaria glabrata]|nr:glutamate receptor U1-like [Biomphalaria glabrata]
MRMKLLIIMLCYVVGAVRYNKQWSRLALGNDVKTPVETIACNEIHDVVIVTTSDGTFETVPWILSHPFLSCARMIHYNVDHAIRNVSQMTEWMWDFYKNKQMSNFLLVSTHYKLILDSVHQLYYERQRDEGAVLPHKTTFTIIVSTEDINLNENLPNMSNAVLDNIALFVVDTTSQQVTHILTLMYREQRQREWDSIDLNQTLTTRSYRCHVFPNMEFGLNRRHLTILAKEWISHLKIQENARTGEFEYVGLYVDIIKALSFSLNFTFSFTPDPAEENPIEWNDFSNRVGFGEVDFGATTYLLNSVLYFNHSLSFPIIWNNISGVYVNNERLPVTSPLKLFQPEVYLCLLLSLLFASFLYLFFAHVSKKYFHDSLLIYQNVECRSDMVRQESGQSASNDDHYTHREEEPKHLLIETASTSKQNMTGIMKGLSKDHSLLCTNSSTDIVDTFQSSDKTVDTHYSGTSDQSHSTEAGQESHTEEEMSAQRNMNTNPCSLQSRSIGTQTRDNQDINLPRRSIVYLVKCSNSIIFSGNETNELKHHQKENEGSLAYICGCDILNTKTKRKGCGKISKINLESCISVFFKFLGSIFSQDSLPEPKLFSARLLVWSWCFMLLALTSVFTGNITANLVDQEESIPIKTYEQLLQRGDYTWGLFQESSFFNILKNSKRGTILKRLYDQMELFAQVDPKVRGPLEDQLTKVRTEKYVTFFFSDEIEYLQDKINISDLVIMKEKLMTTSMGFIFPKKSALSDLISERLMLMWDVGLLEHFARTNSKGSNSAKIWKAKDSSDMALDVYYMEGLFYCCGCGVAAAAAVLVLEYLYFQCCIRCQMS